MRVVSWVGTAYPSVELGENSQHRKDPPPMVTHVVALVWKAGAWDSRGTGPVAL